jgi:DNA-binding phage protein
MANRVLRNEGKDTLRVTQAKEKEKLFKSKDFKNFLKSKNITFEEFSKLPANKKDKLYLYPYQRRTGLLNKLPDKGKNYITALELSDLLKPFGINYGSFGAEGDTLLAKKINELLDSKVVKSTGEGTFGAQKADITGDRGFLFFKKPTKSQLQEIAKFKDAPNLRNSTVEAMKVLHKKLYNTLKNKKFPTLEKTQAILKNANLGNSPAQAARAMSQLARVYGGTQFQNDFGNIKVNKATSKFIVKEFGEYNLLHPWRRGVYVAALDDIKDAIGDEAGDLKKFKNRFDQFLLKKYPGTRTFDLNEVFSVTASARNKSYPYAYFVDVIDSNLNQVDLAAFHGNMSLAEERLSDNIKKYRRTGNIKFYNKAKEIADKFNNQTRKSFLNTIKKNYPGESFNLTELKIGKPNQVLDNINFAGDFYKENKLKKWKNLGIDIGDHTAKAGYIKTGADKKGVLAIQELFTSDYKVDPSKVDPFVKNIFNKLQARSKLKQCKIPAADGGRIGFANSIECIQDGINETKKAAAAGDKKAARQLVETAEAASKGGRLLKNVLGPGALLGEALFEGAIIGNKVLGGKPLKQAWAESYLSYLDPRKYSGELDPTLMQREQMLESTADKDILQSGFDAQDRISALNEARRKEELAEIRQRPDQLMTEAEREKLRAYEKQSSPFIKDSQLQKDADIISSEAFKDASNIAQEYIQGQEGKQRFDLGILGTPRGELSEDRRMFEANKAMKNLYTQYSDDEIRSYLKQELGTDDDKLIDRYLDLTRVTERIVPSIARTLSGLDVLRTGDQIQQATQRIADAGGVANLARGGRAGFKLGKLTKLRKSKVREDVKNIIDDSIKKQEEREFSPNLDLDALIKKTLDEDFFDKKDRIVDTLNIKAIKERKNFPYNQQVQEEPSQLNFYDDIAQSNFRTKTGPFFDYQKRKNKAGGGILKQAGDSSGPPPESGPNPQGLQGLIKRGMKI